MSMIQIPVHQAQKLSDLPTISHGFFGRRGGVSKGIYESLNAGIGSDDWPEVVAENRARIAEVIGAPTHNHLQSVYQIHGADVVHLTKPLSERPEGDAMVTRAKGVALCILTADCAPILFADNKAGVIGAAHAGWKGAVAGAAERTVEAMVELGAQPKHIRAVVGPCIAQRSYEVGPEFHETIMQTAPWADSLFAPGEGDRLHFNLQTFVKNKLARLKLGWVDVIAHDTYEMSDIYFSNRRRVHAEEPDYGRNASVIMLKP